jgi:hypothetical protein
MPSNSLIYCDLPYFGTTSYSGTEPFNYEYFYNWSRNMSKYNKIFISEYQMPPDFQTVLEIPVKTDMSNKEGKKFSRVEKLFTYNS